ncbi:MAG: thioredoxin domain-containing protein [Elusimicrobia bacterium]|nr:thioredoxin domain-containing protein [Elusimicrobiota bacterium]
MSNRLARESSPYLLQHGENPVQWYPWGEEAFDAARRENKPLLISIGYSTCHWCHVMERECFENPAIAAVMNEYLIAVKVDREERPEVDRLYMTAVRAMTGQGGWPLNAFATPEGKPFTGGTYFPPSDRHGRRGWPAVVEAVGKAWRNPAERERLIAQSEGLTRAVRDDLIPAVSSEGFSRGEALKACFSALEESYDEANGGFYAAPKFPMPVNQSFLFRYGDAVGGDAGRRVQAMALSTLRGMARGGIFDVLGGGFHRYSTDGRWFLPHFEKMLYDNAQLAVNDLEAFQLTGDRMFAETAGSTLDYLLRDLTHPEGGFFSAEDADSFPGSGEGGEKREGAFYVWEAEEIQKILGSPDAALFSARYGVESAGNVMEDPQGEFSGKNVLFEARSLEESARAAGIPLDEASRRLEAARTKLLSVRTRRCRPLRDDKILTSWNGLALSAFARGAAVLGEDRYRVAAQKAAAFIQGNLWDGERLYRRWREGKRDIVALADDHVFLAQGLVDLYETDFKVERLFWAERLMEETLGRFQDPATGSLFSAPADHDPHLILRAREEGDNVEPSAASVAAMTLLRLARYRGREDFHRAAQRMIEAHLAFASGGPRAFPLLLAASLLVDRPSRELVIAGDPLSPETRGFLAVARRMFLPDLSLILADGGPGQVALAERLPFLRGVGPVGGRPAAFLCHSFSCQTPAFTPEDLERGLDKPEDPFQAKGPPPR